MKPIKKEEWIFQHNNLGDSCFRIREETLYLIGIGNTIDSSFKVGLELGMRISGEHNRLFI